MTVHITFGCHCMITLIVFCFVAAARVLKLSGNPVRSSSGTTLTLSWQRLSPVESRGTIIAFQINISERVDEEISSDAEQVEQGSCIEIGEPCTLRDGRSEVCCLVWGNQSSANITDLRPHLAYNVSIAAVNGAGLGERSKPVTVPGIGYRFKLI